MALTTCKDCGNQVSTEAAACPKCGRPRQVRSPEQAQSPEQAREDGMLAQHLLINWDRFSDTERAKQARELILRAAPGTPVETFSWGQLKTSVENIVAALPVGHQKPLVRNLSRTTAGLLALLLGGVGVHRFYLGRPGSGILYLLFCWTLVPALIGLVEGIVLLSMKDAEFAASYCT